MYNIAIATTSRYKINAIRKVLNELDLEFESTSVAVPSGVSEQPSAPGETRKGAETRALNALQKSESTDFAIGVEFGYEPWDDGKLHMTCFASVAYLENGSERENKIQIITEQSSTLELPPALHEVLKQDKNVGDYLHLATAELPDKECYRIFDRYLRKRTFIYQAVEVVMLRYLVYITALPSG